MCTVNIVCSVLSTDNVHTISRVQNKKNKVHGHMARYFSKHSAIDKSIWPFEFQIHSLYVLHGPLCYYYENLKGK